MTDSAKPITKLEVAELAMSIVYDELMRVHGRVSEAYENYCKLQHRTSTVPEINASIPICRTRSMESMLKWQRHLKKVEMAYEFITEKAAEVKEL